MPGYGVLVMEVNTHRLQMFSSVAIATHPVSATVALGVSATFSVTLASNSSTAALTFMWTKGGVTVGANSSSYTYTGVDADSGSPKAIVCTVIHATGRAVSNTATLTVQVCSRVCSSTLNEHFVHC